MDGEKKEKLLWGGVMRKHRDYGEDLSKCDLKCEPLLHFQMWSAIKLCNTSFVGWDKRTLRRRRIYFEGEWWKSRGSIRGGARGAIDPPDLETFRDLISEKGDFVILVTLLWPPAMKILTEPLKSIETKLKINEIMSQNVSHYKFPCL